MTDSNTNFNQNSAKIYTGSAGGELYISTNSSKQTISASNNRSQYYAEQAKKYRDEAKLLRDDTKYYAEQNSDVTVEFVNNVKAEILNVISTKQDSGDYALKSELPINVSELENDSEYVTNSEFPTLVEEFLPEQENNAGKFLMTNSSELSWQSILGFSLFDTTLKDHVLTYEESKGLALQGTYVYKEAIAGSRYGYPDFYAKCLEEYTEATSTETVNDVEVKVHSNGHKFYNISDKTAIDDFFNSMGSAWFYGVDTENERIFLPRNNYFDQLTANVKKLLYICVGNSTNYEGMTEVVNQGMEILEQVSQKVNIDGSNLNQEGKNLISSYAMPSDNYVDFNVGANGATYTAPANGWVRFSGKPSSGGGQAIGLRNENSKIETISRGVYQSVFIPVRKFDPFTIIYDVAVSDTVLYFVYAEGEI